MTSVEMKFTGLIRGRTGCDRMPFSFDGATLGELLDAFFTEYDFRDMILDEGNNVIPWSRVAINGRFSYLTGDMDTPIEDDDLVVLIRPYAVAF